MLKQYFAILLSFGLFVGLVSCDNTAAVTLDNEVVKEVNTDNPTDEPQEEPQEESQTPTLPQLSEKMSDDEKALNAKANIFAFDFMRAVADNYDIIYQFNPSGNFSVSPLSAMICLGLTANAYDDEMRESIAKMLNTDNLDALNALNWRLMQELPDEKNGAKLQLSNALWWHDFDGLKLNKEFTDVATNMYYADIFPVNFLCDDVDKIVNAWCVEKTDGLIKDIMPGNNPNNRMVCGNAMLYYGMWNGPFDKAKTKRETFYGTNGTSTVDMMHQSQELKVYTDELVDCVIFPFAGLENNLVLIMPRGGFTIDDALAGLDSERWNKIAYHPNRLPIVELSMPKFVLESKGAVETAFLSLGLNNGGCLHGAYNQHIPARLDVSHGTYVSFDEDGAKIAGVTVSYMCTSNGEEPDRLKFNLNRPFIFVIYNQEYGTVLMAGRVCNL